MEYEITLRRTVDEYLTVTIDAGTDDEAVEKATALATAADTGAVGGLEWERCARNKSLQTERIEKGNK